MTLNNKVTQLLKAVSVVAIALVSFSVNADDKVYRLTLAETWNANTPILGDASKNMAKLANEMSNGRLQIRIGGGDEGDGGAGGGCILGAGAHGGRATEANEAHSGG